MNIKLAIFSACSFQRFSPYNNNAMAAYTNYLAKKHGYRTRLYTDLKNYKLLQRIEYDEIILLDEKIINQFPSRGWSLGKILAMSMVNEPFIHLDFDLLLINDIPEYIKHNSFFVFHHEPYMKFNKKIIQKLYNKYPNPNELDHTFVNSKNCAIIGVNDYKTVNECCQKIIDYAINNKDLFNKYGNLIFKFKQDNVFIAVFLEQILLLNLIRKKVNYIPTIINNRNFEEISKRADELKLFHLWGDKTKIMHLFKQYSNKQNLKF